MVDHGRSLQRKVDHCQPWLVMVNHIKFCSPWLTIVNHVLTMVNPDHFYLIMLDLEHDGDLSLLTCVCCNGEHGQPGSLTMVNHSL